MNGEKLLRAMSYVDEDLVDRAEKASRHRIPWTRFAALAACLCLALGGWMMIKAVLPAGFSAKNLAPMAQDAGGADEAKSEAIMDAPEETEAPAGDENGEDAAPRAEESGIEPAVTTGAMDTGDWFIRMDADSAINAAADLQIPKVIRTRRELEGYAIPTEVLERYGEGFFETRDLLLAAVEGGKEHPQVIRLEDTGDGWVLTVSGSTEGEDAFQWRLLLPIEKDKIPEDTTIHIEEELK